MPIAIFSNALLKVASAVALTAAMFPGPLAAVASTLQLGARITEPAVRGPVMKPTATEPVVSCDLATVETLAAQHRDVDQFIVMATDSFEATTGSVWIASRRGGQWLCDTAPVTARFGRAGTRPLIQRRSGDGTTPAGVFPLGEQTAWDGEEFSLFGNRPAPAQIRARYRQVRNEDCWGATPQDPNYQKLINRPNCPGPDDEWLPRYGDVYSHAAVIGANLNDGVSGDEPDEPAYAAAIFLHRHAYTASGATKPTSGCISIEYDDLVLALQTIDPALNPHFAIGPTDWLAG